MKLMMVTPYFYPKTGGLENYAYNMAYGLQKTYGLDIVVVTSNHKKKKDVVETINGMKVYRLAPLFKLSNTPVNPFWHGKIKKIIKNEKPDVINAHSPVPFIADIAARVSSKTPFILTYHAFTIKKTGSPLLNFVISCYSFFERFLFKKAHKIIIVSDVIKTTVAKKFRDKVITIYNSLPSKDITQKNVYPNKKEIKIVFISSLDKSHNWKGLDEILLAIKLLHDKTKNRITLNIIGDGDDKIRYQKIVKKYKIQKQVKFLGSKTGKEKNSILRNSSIGIIYPKSSNDAFPTVALEYWANFLPIIVADIIPLNTIFSHKKTAYFVEPKNSKSLSKQITFLINNPSLLQKIAKRGKEELRKKYILEHEVKKFYMLLKGVPK